MLSAYGLTIEDIRKALMLRSINIPVIENADDFRKFLKEVNVGQNAIAIIGFVAKKNLIGERSYFGRAYAASP